jgi:hypothetical protein
MTWSHTKKLDMPLHPSLAASASLSNYYKILLTSSNTARRDQLLKARFDRACAADPHMQPGATSKQKYYKGLAQSLKSKVLIELTSSLNNGTCPELHITLQEGKNVARALGYTDFGSPQDFLYGFTSERYPNWSKALAAMGFVSAVMVGEQHAVVTMAPHDLDFSNPTKEIDELAGAIATDFWETGALTGSKPTFRELLDVLNINYVATPTVSTIDGILLNIRNQLQVLPTASGYRIALAQLAEVELTEIEQGSKPSSRKQRFIGKIGVNRPLRPNENQEQIALKYVEEGNLLQKLLGGRRVDHIQSNVKNQKNPLRGSGCEVDSIYRVVGEKCIVLVEAKAGDKISRSQLYQMYETFRLKLPYDWKVITIGVLLSSRKVNMPTTVNAVIDMVEIKFDDDVFGRVTESLLNMSIVKHYRWLIHQ